jgi:hypothetical protein
MSPKVIIYMNEDDIAVLMFYQSGIQKVV